MSTVLSSRKVEEFEPAFFIFRKRRNVHGCLLSVTVANTWFIVRVTFLCKCSASSRLYLINSPVVRAENLRFKEEGVRDVLKDVLLPWYNAYRFFIQNVFRLHKVWTTVCMLSHGMGLCGTQRPLSSAVYCCGMTRAIRKPYLMMHEVSGPL